MKCYKLATVAVIISLSCLISVYAGPFDEVTGVSDTQVRPAYQGVIEIYNSLSSQKKRQIEQATSVEFAGDNPLLPLPKVLTVEESKQLQLGTAQRGRALQAFLQDHYGNKEYLKDGIIPEDVITRIVERNNESMWAKYIRPAHIQFWYGPDIIRGPPTEGFPEGRFMVVEDNPTFIGGPGDLIQARKSIFKHVPEYKKLLGDSPDPGRFYDQLADNYKFLAKQRDGVAVLVAYASDISSDNEGMRVEKIFKERGMEVVIMDYRHPKNNRHKKKVKRIVTDKDGVWLIKPQRKGPAKRIKVGHILNNLSPADIEMKHPANRQAFILEEAHWHIDPKEGSGALNPKAQKKLKALLQPDKTGNINVKTVESFIRRNTKQHWLDYKFGIPGIINALKKGKVSMTNPPGIEFIGDKEFYIYVEDLIAYYLKETPIISNIPSVSFRTRGQVGKTSLNLSTFKEVFNKIKTYVIKKVDGRGGDGVWVGPKTTAAEVAKVKKLVMANPGHYIAQVFTALSTLAGHIGDIRQISEIGIGRQIVAETSWARVVSKNGNGKVNISDQGKEAVVLVRNVTNILSCTNSLNGFARAM
ncbi:MAG: circularly permuted type 2 ATP-grasp protein [Bacteriovoracaceae bacterium]|nr:circularly permuted type 2 ATP-grasp protein [Bacteriovoracaceae bacterium]